MVGEYGFGGLPERSWVIGARPLRHIMRLLDLSQPRRRLSGTPSRIPVGYPQGWPAGVARWKVIGQVPTRMVMLEVSELLADLLARQDAPDVSALTIPPLRVLLRRRRVRMVPLKAMTFSPTSTLCLRCSAVGCGSPIQPRSALNCFLSRRSLRWAYLWASCSQVSDDASALACHRSLFGQLGTGALDILGLDAGRVEAELSLRRLPVSLPGVMRVAPFHRRLRITDPAAFSTHCFRRGRSAA